jgi:hypothetical protein
MNRKGFATRAVVLIVTVVLLVAGGTWYYETRPQPSQSQQNQAVSIAKTATTTGPNPLTVLETYINRTYGFQFQYPATLSVFEEGPHASQSGTQPDSLDTIGVYDNNSDSALLYIEIYNSGIVLGNYGWPERPCGEWTFGPDDGPVSSKQISFAGQKTLDVVSRGFGESTSSFLMNEYYCVNYARYPLVITFDQPQEAEVQPVLSTFQFLTRPGSSALP